MEQVLENNAKFFDKILMPFKKFGGLFKASNLYSRICLILQITLLCSGPLAFGVIEYGLVLFVLFYALAFGLGYVSYGFFNKSLEISGFSYAIVAIILVLAVLGIFYVTFAKTIELAEKQNKGESTFKSIVYDACYKLGTSFVEWVREFRTQFSVGDAKVKTLLPLSFFSLGIPLIVFGKVVKGVGLLVVQLLAILFMIARGFSDLELFFTLNTTEPPNSVIVYGVIAIVVTLLFVYFYVVSIKATLEAAKEYNEKRLGANFKRQLYNLIDKNFYVTSLIIPVLGALIFTVIPLLFMISSAFTNYSNVSAAGYSSTASVGFLEWIGFDAFKRMFATGANLQDLLSVFAWTMIWALLATFSCFFGGLFLAMLINKKTVKCKALFRSLFVVSMAMPQFVSLLVMRTFFEDYGPLQTFLTSIGLMSNDATMNLWTTEFSARMLIILINMWVGIPYYMLLMSGLLINIPKGYYEAAKISGASRWQQFTRITFPNIMFMTAPMLITSFVNNINNFNVIWFLTRGDPANDSIAGTAGKTDILITWLYKLTMRKQDYNFGAAIGIIMFIITATLSLVVFHRSSSYKNEEEYR